MTTEKNAIENAAINFSLRSAVLFENSDREAFIQGAKSEAAREFWQNEMYSEEEVKQILRDFYKLPVINVEGEFCPDLWFENNKSKTIKKDNDEF